MRNVIAVNLIKTCCRCQTPKPLTEFGKLKRNPDGHKGFCQLCARTEGLALYYDNQPKSKTDVKRWRAANPDKVKQYRKEETRKNLYGLRPGEFDAILAHQEGRCAICRQPISNPQIDHNHQTGETRGLLCWNCNAALGSFHDDQTRILRAAEYVLHPPVVAALGAPRFGLPGRIRTKRANRRAQARDMLTTGLVPPDAYAVCAPDIVAGTEITTKHQKRLQQKNLTPPSN